MIKLSETHCPICNIRLKESAPAARWCINTDYKFFLGKYTIIESFYFEHLDLNLCNFFGYELQLQVNDYKFNTVKPFICNKENLELIKVLL